MNAELDDLRTRLLLAQSENVSLRDEVRRLHRQLGHREAVNRKKVSDTKRALVFSLTDGSCFYCSDPITREQFSVDHLLPLSRGGSEKVHNMVPACVQCNNRKADRLPTQEEYIRAKQFRQLRHQRNEARRLTYAMPLEVVA